MAAATPVLEPALWTAAERGCYPQVGKLLREGADIEEPGGKRVSTPLHVAAMKGYPIVVRLLLQKKAQVAAKDYAGDTPLHSAALGGHTLHYGTEENDGQSGVGWRCRRGPGTHDAVAQLLLDNGAKVGAKNDKGATPLHLAVRANHLPVVQLLIDAGADVLSKTNDGETPEDLASWNHDIVAMLKAEVQRRARCAAFAMGQQERLGAGSRVQELEPGVVRMVLDHVIP